MQEKKENEFGSICPESENDFYDSIKIDFQISFGDSFSFIFFSFFILTAFD